MAPFDVIACEKFMRDNNIKAMSILFEGLTVYHAYITSSDEFNYHEDNKVPQVYKDKFK